MGEPRESVPAGDLLGHQNDFYNEVSTEASQSNQNAPESFVQGRLTSAALSQNYLTSSIPGEDRRALSNTIDETVWDTISRDVLAVWSKLKQVLWPRYLLGRPMHGQGLMAQGPSEIVHGLSQISAQWSADDLLTKQSGKDELRHWDLWGPLVFCLLLSLLLSITKSGDQASAVFSGVFALIWIGEAVVTAQIKLLGGNISFLQSICIIGYTLFPLVIAALLSALRLPMLARLPVFIVLIIWSLAAGISILMGSGIVKNRVAIAAYPLFVFYVGLGCLCLIS